MQLSEEAQLTPYRIRRYQAGEVLINDQAYQQSLILTTEELITPWPVTDIKQLSANNLDIVLSYQPDVFLLGTGHQQTFPTHEILAAIINANIGYEVMSTEAACRTYNLLANEKRNILAALIL